MNSNTFKPTNELKLEAKKPTKNQNLNTFKFFELAIEVVVRNMPESM